MVKWLVTWGLNRLKEKSTLVGIALAVIAYFGIQVLPDCTGIKLCITEDMWGRLIEAGSYLVSAALVVYVEKPKDTITVVELPPEYPVNKNQPAGNPNNLTNTK